MKIFSCFCSFFLSLIGYSCSISASQCDFSKEILETFFRTFSVNSEAGYVLFGEKPICVHGYSSPYEERYHTDDHVMSSHLYEGIKAWEKLQNKIPNNNNYLIVTKAPVGREQFVQILIINRAALYKEINRNIVLFQYVFGPTITAEQIFKKIIDPHQTLWQALNHDKVLIGIVLGFGVQNALFGSRAEYFRELTYCPAIMPYRSLHLDLTPPLSQTELLWNDYTEEKNSYCINHPKNLPSSSYSLESQKIEDLITISSEKLENCRPRFIYGGVKKHPDNIELIKRLEKEQLEIITLLESNLFFEKALKKFGLSTDMCNHLTHNPNFEEPESSQLLTSLIATDLYERMSIREINKPQYAAKFMKGMEYGLKAHDLDKWQNQHYDLLYNADIFNKVIALQSKLREVEEFFEKLKSDSTVHTIVPEKLLYTTLKKGSGEPIKDTDQKVLLHYEIYHYPNEIVCAHSHSPEWIDLTKAIEGFAKGCVGMRIGEVRKLYIHPDLAYGIYTVNFHKGACLIANIQLLDILKNGLEKVEHPISTEPKENLPAFQEIDEIKIKSDLAYFEGMAAGYHYKCIKKFFNFDQLETQLNRMFVSKKPDDVASQVNFLQWWLYKKKREDQQEIATATFKKFLNNTSFTTIIPNNVIYQQKLKGSFDSPVIDATSTPLIHYRISDLNGRTFEDTNNDQPKRIDMQRIIRGLRLGLIGLKEGEKGIFYISPEYGFSFDYYFPYGDTSLMVEVEVVKATTLQQAQEKEGT